MKKKSLRNFVGSEIKVGPKFVTLQLPRSALSHLSLNKNSELFCTINNGIIQISNNPAITKVPILFLDKKNFISQK